MIFPPNFSDKREWLLTIPITPPEKCISDPKHDHLTRPKYTSRNIKKYWKWTTFNSQQFPQISRYKHIFGGSLASSVA